MSHVKGTDYPKAYLSRIPTHARLGDRPVIVKWLGKREPLVIDPIRDLPPIVAPIWQLA